MNISDSPLFKDYARPVLKSGAHRARASSYSPSGIKDTAMQHLLNLAKLEASRFKISDATEDSFCLAIESRLASVRAISSTIDAMNTELFFNGFSFGKIKLPEIHTSFWGTDVAVEEQRIDITNRATYHTFIRSLIVDQDTALQLKSSSCKVRALGTLSTCDLCLDIPLKSLGGPRITLKKLSRAGEDVAATFSFSNPSPVEIDHGRCIFELRNTNGETLAELKGELNIVHGQTDLVLNGTRRNGAGASDRARLVGIGAEASGNERSRCRDTVREVDAVFELKPEYARLLW
ncbi:hypothetical protein F66182_1803 [Fusarium sp. NRRL 66182]|nr:hypothetical protein F66182_1803 [Fusarium sp. NRRL 66182]